MLNKKFSVLNRSWHQVQQLHQSFTRSLSLKPSLSASKEPSQEKTNEKEKDINESPESQPIKQPNANKTKSVSQSDAELRERLEQMSGEGGAAGIEYEDGKPNAMKRGVRNNMFRLI